jgi:hypothetical protein
MLMMTTTMMMMMIMLMMMMLTLLLMWMMRMMTMVSFPFVCFFLSSHSLFCVRVRPARHALVLLHVVLLSPDRRR